GAGTDGVASGINPSGGNLSKEGIDAGPPKQQTRFRYGEAPDASGDKGRALIQRPGIPPLITRPGEDEPEGSESAAQGVAGGSGHLAAASAPGGDMTSMPPAAPGPSASGTPASGSGPSATGSATPTNWVYPTQPPSGS
ncbi:SCO6881 family protein, partial [Streptomyces albidoflavus]